MEFVCLTQDGASTVSMTSVEALTAHYVTPDWKLKSHVLAVEEMQDRENAMYLQGLTEFVMAKWGIGRNSALVTDGAAVMLKVARDLVGQHQITESARYGKQRGCRVPSRLTVPDNAAAGVSAICSISWSPTP